MLQWPPQRRNRLLLSVGLVALVCVALWLARGALFPYFLGLVLAYLMLPLVNRLDQLCQRAIKRPQLARPIAILLVYLITIALVVAFFWLVAPVAGGQFRVLWLNRDTLMLRLQNWAASGLAWYQLNVPPDLQTYVTDALQRVGGTLASGVQAGVLRTVGVLSNTVSFFLGIIVVPFWLFYILNDELRVARGILSLAPPRFRADFRNIFRITDRILSAYIRGQLLLCLFIGVMATAGLTLLGVQFPVALGLIAGLLEVLPFIGPILGLIPAVIVATIQEPILGLWTLLLFIGIQQVENVLLVPRISGKAVELHPALIMVVLVVGNEMAGLLGMLVVVPLTAIGRDLFKYFYWRFQDTPLAPGDALARFGHL